MSWGLHRVYTDFADPPIPDISGIGVGPSICPIPLPGYRASANLFLFKSGFIFKRDDWMQITGTPKDETHLSQGDKTLGIRSVRYTFCCFTAHVAYSSSYRARGDYSPLRLTTFENSSYIKVHGCSQLDYNTPICTVKIA